MQGSRRPLISNSYAILCSAMKQTCWLASLALVLLLWAPEARAQYANRSLGAGVGFIGLSGGDTATGLGATIPIWLEGNLYIENGFDLFLRVPFMIVSSQGNAMTNSGNGFVFGTGGDLGVRYLFLEENIRPWLGVYLTGLVVLGATTVVLVGPGAAGGLDFFVTDSASIGIRAFFNLYLELNAAPTFGPGAAANVSFYF